VSIKDAIRLRTRTLVSQAAESRSGLNHNGLYGENNEGLLSDALRERLPVHWEVASGEVVDVKGKCSPQCDIIIYDRRSIPCVYTGSKGCVVVAAHAVGAVVEVKSALHNGPDALGLCKQMKRFRKFFAASLAVGAKALQKEACDQGASKKATELIRSLAKSRIPVFGFAFESLVQANTIASHLLLEDQVDPIYVLDMARSWDDGLKKDLSALGTKPTREDVMKFVNRVRDPNGYSFWVDGYNCKGVPTFQAATHRHSIDALGMFVKEIADRVRTTSPIRVELSSKAAEIAYSTYHPWTRAYFE